MSVRIMTRIWEMRKLSPVEKLSLLALADWANDDGLAWPSINQIADKTGCARRTVQKAFLRAEKEGILTRHQVTGRGCKYIINPCTSDTPATDAPVQESAHTRAPRAPNTPTTHQSSEPKGSSGKRSRASTHPFPCPEGVDEIDWDGLKENRKQKRSAFTEAAHRQILNKLHEWELAGWPPGPIVANAAERGWTTVFETDEMKNGSSNNQQQRKTSDGGRPSGWLS